VHLVDFIIRIYHEVRSSETKVSSHVLFTHSLMVIKVTGKFHDGTIFLVHQVDTPHTDFVANKSLLLQATLGILFMLRK
jgi:hypothetical protein